MNCRKELKNKPAPIKIGTNSGAKTVVLELLFLEDDPLFSKFASRFIAHVTYPFTHCEFSLLCKPRAKTPKPISTVRFDFDFQSWKLSDYDDHDYAVKRAMISAESPDILLAALANHWRIENLHEFRLSIEGATQMKLPFERQTK